MLTLFMLTLFMLTLQFQFQRSKSFLRVRVPGYYYSYGASSETLGLPAGSDQIVKFLDTDTANTNTLNRSTFHYLCSYVLSVSVITLDTRSK